MAHSHRAPDDEELVVGRTVRTCLLAALAAVALATVVGAVALWPDSGKLDAIRHATPFAAPGVTTVSAEVLGVAPACPTSSQAADTAGCGTVDVNVVDGAGKGDHARVRVPPEVTASGLGAGDRVQLLRAPGRHGSPVSYTFDTVERNVPLLWIALGFAIVVAAVARLRGLMALVGLVISGLTIYTFLLPALLTGEPAIPVTVVTAAAIMFVVLYTTHGANLRTSTALAGTLIGIALTAGISVLAIHLTHLSGVADETGGMVATFAGGLDFQGLLTAGVILAGLGVLNDVTITQASSVWELRSASPEMSPRHLFVRAMRIGRDHIASTIYTIAFAYAGASLAVLMLLTIYDRPLVQLISEEPLAEEIARTIATSIGLVLAVPITTAIATVVTTNAQPEPVGGRRSLPSGSP